MRSRSGDHSSRIRSGRSSGHTGKASCCGSGSILEDGKLDPITQNLYATEETDGLPKPLWLPLDAGNPTALATIQSGSGVGSWLRWSGSTYSFRLAEWAPTGKVYGLDMTDDMLKPWHGKTSARLVSPM